ncbi:MAG TPA: NAD-dependent deacylase [Vicinamibacterales bacterium]|jgi:NAD-dependent deacetylase|nr:NAD-dependent deacylase [Vicinamibacterales bacterium]
MDDAIVRLRTLLDSSKRITVVTGSGVSAASGVPTFRGAGGLWRNFRAEELATASAFRRDPQLVWDWYDWRRGIIARCEPNAAHLAIARWSRRPGFTLVTQNVDGLHERAGTSNVVRYHGSIWHLRCSASCGQPDWEDRRVPLPDLPRCSACGALARPAVVWFGEAIDPAVAAIADAACACDLFLSIGTSSVVYPAAGLLGRARLHGATSVEINPDATPSTSSVDFAIAMAAEQALESMD